MKTVFLGRHDYANTSHRIARALRSAGREARVIVEKAHPFGYQEDVVLERPGAAAEARRAAEGAAYVVATGDGHYDTFEDLARSLGLWAVPRATRHAGSAYRAQPGFFDAQDEALGFRRRLMACDLYCRHGVPGRDAPFLAPQRPRRALRREEGVLRLCHSPSRRSTKATDVVLRAVARLFEAEAARASPVNPAFEHIQGVPYSEARRRRGRCHVLIDAMSDLGAFGAAACEAMADGLAVVTDAHHVTGAVEDFFPRPPLIDTRPEDLYDTLASLLARPAEVLTRRPEALAWAQAHLSYAALGPYYDRLLR